MVLNDRLELFQNMLLCCHDLYLWTFDQNMALESSNCPQAAVMSGLLAVGNRLEDTRTYAQTSHAPLLMSNALGLMWIADPERDEKGLRRIHVLGPFFMDSVSLRGMEERTKQLGLSAAICQDVVEFFRALPVISLSRALEYAAMLHYCICGERIGISDMNYWDAATAPGDYSSAKDTPDAHGTYEAEQEMLRIVREGDIQNLKRHMDKMSTIGHTGKLSDDSMRQMQNAVEVCIVLFSRAAIEGGLAPEVSYTITDHYFQQVEACQSIAELTDVSLTMQEDFVQRVYRCRSDEGISKPVRACIDYIELNLEEEITLQKLASLSGYSEYYLSKRFKKEVGITPKEHIRKKRLERAKFLLCSTQMDVQEISERLHFCSHSYFADAFRKETGLSPTQWREQETAGTQRL